MKGGVKMKQSQFNVVFKPSKNSDKIVIFNTFHDHRLVIDNPNNQALNFLKKIDLKEPLSKEEQETAKALLELGLLLNDHENEKEIFDNWYVEKIQTDQYSLNLILLMTMACNLRCPYCYELDQLDNSKNMTIETANHIINWAKSQIKKKPIQKLEITYFGGEPLMNKKVMLHISNELKTFCKKYGVTYDGGIITNGVLMTKKTSQAMREAGIKWAKITIDGDKHVHDTTRITASGKGSFDVIFKNMNEANQDLKPGETPLYFNIGGNFKSDTYQGFYSMLDKLANAKFKPFIQRVNLKPVQEVDYNPDKDVDELGNNPCDINCFTPKNIDIMVGFREELRKRDLPPIDNLDMGPCDFYRGDSYTIGLDGVIYPCIAFVDNTSTAIGHVEIEKTITRHYKKHQQWLDTKPWTEDCYQCSFLPVCVGGCRATAHSNGKSWNSEVCEKQYFNRMAKAMAEELHDLEIQSEQQVETQSNDFVKNEIEQKAS